uniref:Uncharacterized protein n=1 Tax=Ditylenchus dipsaci TaxID=166011 RepID=A0A915ESG2_9BILA
MTVIVLLDTAATTCLNLASAFHKGSEEAGSPNSPRRTKDLEIKISETHVFFFVKINDHTDIIKQNNANG